MFGCKGRSVGVFALASTGTVATLSPMIEQIEYSLSFIRFFTVSEMKRQAVTRGSAPAYNI